MAALVRSMGRQGRNIFVYISKNQIARIPVVPIIKKNAFISTSQKDKGVGVSVEPMDKSTEMKGLVKHFEDHSKDNEENWTSYGYEPGDRDSDWFLHNLVMFLGMTVWVSGLYFISNYSPENRFNDWCQREAFLQLERREKLGLPLVDSNYVDPAKICLPSDEEIGDQEIII